jgi:hypothetical protein
MSLGDCMPPVGVARRVAVGSARRSWLRFPLWIRELGCSGSMVLARGRVNGGHRRKAACGGFGRHRPSGEAQGFILYLIKTGSCPFGSGGPSEERWAGGPRERGESSDRVQPSLATVGAAVDIGPEHAREEGLDGFCSRGAGVGASRATRQAARCSVPWRLARRP